MTCRTPYLSADDRQSFWPAQRSSSGFGEMEFQAFNSNQTHDYIVKHLKIRQEKGENNLWALKQYLDYLEEHPELKQIVVDQPLLLRIMTDTLPHIVLKNQNTVSHSNKVTTLELFDAFFCCTVERELRKQRRQVDGIREFPDFPGKPKLAYLNYAIKFALAMQTYIQKVYPNKIEIQAEQVWISLADPEALPIFSPFFEDLIHPEKEATTNILRRCCPIIQRDNKWGYRHAEYYAYFKTAATNPYHRTSLEKRLQNDEYQFKTTIF